MPISPLSSPEGSHPGRSYIGAVTVTNLYIKKDSPAKTPPHPPSLSVLLRIVIIHLQNGPRFVGLDALGHHVQDVVHHRRSQLQVKVGLHPLLRHRLRDTLRVPERTKK